MADLVRITIDNVYAKLENVDKDTELVIWNELSFEEEQYNSEYVHRRHLYNRKTKKTYTGLVPYVERILKERDWDYEIIDTREAHQPNADFQIQPGFSARPYQEKIVSNATEREVLQAATGAGKTFMMASIIARFNVKPVLVFADKIGLCQQIKEEFEKFLGVPVGIIGDGMRDVQDITVCSIQSMVENEDELLNSAKMIMIDEAHHVPASSFVNVMIKCTNAYYRIGVSATPWRDGGDDLLIEAGLSKRKPENNINASFLIRGGFLVPPTIYMVRHKKAFNGKNYNKLYKEAIVENTERNDDIVKIALKMREMRDATTLILIQRVEHGERLIEELFKHIPLKTFSVTVDDPKSGKPTLVRVKNVEFLSGRDGALRRKAVIQAVREKKCEILIGSTIADEGLDVSSLDCLILAGGGRSSTRAFQRIGRVLRLYEEKDSNGSVIYKKERALVFDFIDETPMLKRHSNIRRKLYETEEEWTIKKFNSDLLK